MGASQACRLSTGIGAYWPSMVRGWRSRRLPPVRIVHDRERDAVMLADVHQGNDVRMSQLGQAAHFACKPARKRGIVDEVSARHFDNDVALELVVMRNVDVGHAPFAELAQYAIAPLAQRRAGPFGGVN